MKRSAHKYQASKDRYIKRCQERQREVNQAYVDLFDTMQQADQERDQDPNWQDNNLEYDLRSTDWICAKAQQSASYAQNVYAALCNQEWQRNDVWLRLQGQTWSCTWRYAGGIVADMREQGDYLDWYCSGISGVDEDTPHSNYVGEGCVTDEIREDFFRLGWILVDDNHD